ncbi:MTH1187 family thiamine-binding protein [Paenibacillus hodogayensis]|uniref:MTH1187 family thiamine-binding protein n=1 Tax=Paenibacillus hodogayensis TaxID=279208 RepID=A0ABV5VSG8_9BACL
MPIIEVTVIPVGTDTTSLSGYVAEMQRLLIEAGDSIRYQLTPMSTILEGDLVVLLNVLRRLHESPFAAGANRVCTTIKIDDRRDRPSSMEQKMRSVAEKLTPAP